MPPTATEEAIPGDTSQKTVSSGLRNRRNVNREGENTPQFTWKEVAQHNSLDDIWIIYDGSVYDVTPFVDQHPGGREVLALAAGRDCTVLIESYHPFTDKPKRLLGQYYKGRVVDNEFPRYKPDNSGFYKTVRQRVKAHFDKTQQDPKDPVPGIKRMVPIFALAVVSFICMHDLCNWGISYNWELFWSLIFGFCQVLPLLHCMHDASHTAIGNHEGWWKFWGRLPMDGIAGASMISWQHQHVIGHHVYTNLYEADPDIPDSGEVRRVTWPQKWDFIYKFQWIYLPLLYGLLAFKVRIDDVFFIWWNKFNGHIRVNFYESPWVRVFGVKALWFSWRIALALYLTQQTWTQFAICFCIAELVSGFWLSWNFQVSHISDGVDFPERKPELSQEWAVSQVETSVDYAHDSPIVTFLSGALNYQITHHLFPSVSQYHYPDIAPIVKQTCEEYGIKYRVEPSFWAAFCAHIKHLYDLGQNRTPAEMHMG
eukprot:gb/GECG01014080.1/.p1 GENE.gb/GECG01014080.1/~~gb/GECG01014080.1/.p1  ORF type:complete len:483 (+),score=35.56 gb/GECG01014080.1/:1-1449(+)